MDELLREEQTAVAVLKTKPIVNTEFLAKHSSILTAQNLTIDKFNGVQKYQSTDLVPKKVAKHSVGMVFGVRR